MLYNCHRKKFVNMSLGTFVMSSSLYRSDLSDQNYRTEGEKKKQRRNREIKILKKGEEKRRHSIQRLYSMEMRLMSTFRDFPEDLWSQEWRRSQYKALIPFACLLHSSPSFFPSRVFSYFLFLLVFVSACSSINMVTALVSFHHVITKKYI